MAWSACIKFQKVSTSGISDRLKVKLFRARVEPVLLYGSETWTMNKQFTKTPRWMLHHGPRSSWKPKTSIGSNIPLCNTYTVIFRSISSLSLAACKICRASHESIWAFYFHRTAQATSASQSWNWTALKVLDIVAKDTGVEMSDLKTAMLGRHAWWSIVNGISIENRPK